ncbi:MAG TPA: hypothetical protein VM575_05905, partial [Nocardioides sp.]|nr:hypothetical protein [Nocardioides sp.]
MRCVRSFPTLALVLFASCAGAPKAPSPASVAHDLAPPPPPPMTVTPPVALGLDPRVDAVA